MLYSNPQFQFEFLATLQLVSSAIAAMKMLDNKKMHIVSVYGITELNPTRTRCVWVQITLQVFAHKHTDDGVSVLIEDSGNDQDSLH